MPARRTPPHLFGIPFQPDLRARGTAFPPRASPLIHSRLFTRHTQFPFPGRTHAQTRRHPQGTDHRIRADRDRPGLRVRLFGHPGLQGAAQPGVPDRAGQLQPGHDHDRSGHGRRHLHRTAQRAKRERDHRQGKARRAAAQPGRANGVEPRLPTGQAGRAGEVRGEGDRSRHRRDRTRRRPRGLQADDEIPGHPDAPQRGGLQRGGRREGGRAARVSGGGPPRLYPRRDRRRAGLQRRRTAGGGPAAGSRPASSARC
jgi:hypothetical protein